MHRLFFGPDLFGFLTLHSRDDAVHVGSVLITDAKGVPKEFRYTHPIKPSAIQSSLYGSTLLRHVGIELVGRPLLRSVKKRPQLLFVDRPFLLELARHSDCPVICVTERDAKDDLARSDPTGPAYHMEEVRSADNAIQPLQLVQTKTIHPRTKQLIERLHTEFNVLEPFGRMKKAMETILQ